jgi:hypothetical protein
MSRDFDEEIECPQCGERWFPSMIASELYPGSRCDRGECWCIYCGEDGCEDDCPRLQARRVAGGRAADAANVLRRK